MLLLLSFWCHDDSKTSFDVIVELYLLMCLLDADEAEIAVCGCHCPGDMAVHMFEVLAKPRNCVVYNNNNNNHIYPGSPLASAVFSGALQIKNKLKNYLKNDFTRSNEFKNSLAIVIHKLLSFALKRDNDLMFLKSLSKLFQSLEA